ncbi:MAG: 6-bladed beta-propeller, partial [Candidatus Krumholzibacteria bacterium]|nr:6-bladed beta-propeller [Candidatus Krumholzibacteria bacterium]
MTRINLTPWARAAAGAALSLVFLLVAGVAGAGDWKGKVETVNGVKTVTSPATGFAPPATIKLPELWRLGGDTDDEDEFFGVISDIDIYANGDVYLLDSQLNEVKVYSKDGEFLRAMGREGEGPGEFRGPVAMYFTGDDKVAVLQAVPGKIVLLTLDGQPAGDGVIPKTDDGGFQLLQGGEARGGNTVLFMARTKFDQEANKWSRNGFLASVDASGKQLCEYASKDNTINMSAAEMSDVAWDTFERRWEVGQDGKVYACNSYENYEITVYNKAGGIDKVIKREYKHTARPDNEKKFMETVMGYWAQRIPNCKVTIADMNKDIDTIYVRDDGSIWVLSGAGARNLPKGTLGVFDVFNPDGQFVKTVTLQGRGDPIKDLYVFEKDRLYVVTSFVTAAMSAQGVTGLETEEEPEPMAVICYKLEGDAIAAR